MTDNNGLTDMKMVGQDGDSELDRAVASEVSSLFEQMMHVRMFGIVKVSLLLHMAADDTFTEVELPHDYIGDAVTRSPKEVLVNRDAIVPYRLLLGDEQFGMCVYYLMESRDSGHRRVLARQVFPKCVWREPGLEYAQVEVHARLSTTDADGVDLPETAGGNGQVYSYMEFAPDPLAQDSDAPVHIVERATMLMAQGIGSVE